MDNSFTISLSSLHRSPFSPRPRQSLNSTKRSSLLPGFKKSSRLSVSARSTQSLQIVTKTPYHVVESFGSPLPVLITEALTFADRNTVVSAHISPCGYAWIVCGRRLLVWQYKFLQPTGHHMYGFTSVSLTTQCYELTLPQSDLVHRADLVCIIRSETSNQVTAPACIAVSPEGVVRYWPSISHEGVSVEQNIMLNGQECANVIHVRGVGCILATTTCSVVLISPTNRSLICRTLKPSTGWFGGLSRKLTSLMFGPSNSTNVTETRIVKVLASSDLITSNIYVLVGHFLQKWCIETNNVSEQLLWACDIQKIAREALHSAMIATGSAAMTDSSMDIDVWLLDAQINPRRSEELMFLFGAVNTQKSPQMYYSISSLITNTVEAPCTFHSFTPVKLGGLYREDAEQEVLNYHLLLCGSNIYIYNHRSVIAMGVAFEGEEPDIIEFVNSGDRVLGGSVCVNVPLFFTRNHGLVTLVSNDDNPNSSLAMSEGPSTPVADMSFSESQGNLTLYDLDPNDITINDDPASQLKSAFLYHIKRNSISCTKVLIDTFPMSTIIEDIDNSLDKAVIKVSQDLVNDTPAGDPRWAERNAQSASLGSSTSMNILQQLQDKQRAHELFLNFLKETKLWDRLYMITTKRAAVVSTIHVLAEHAEKIVAALAFRTLHSRYSSIIDIAMRKSLDDEGLQSDSNGLTHHDLFYRSVTRVHRLPQRLVAQCAEQANSELSPDQLTIIINEVNTVILQVIQDVLSYRKQHAIKFNPNKTYEYLPWTATLGSEGLREALTTLHTLTYKHGIRISTPNVQLSEKLYEQLVDLTDILLDGKKSHVESIRGTDKFNILFQQYETERHSLIKPLYDDKQYDLAAMLAEKYCDFLLLIMICESTENQDRLDKYMDQFATSGFPEFVFSWYVRERKQGKLMAKLRNTPGKQPRALIQLISDYPSLAWIQKANNKSYTDASNILYALGKEENEFLMRKKSMLSLSKLAQLAAPDTNEELITDIDLQLELIGYQENIPDIVLSEHGYKVNEPCVLSPAELIKLYISSENDSATEFEFKKALDLLSFVQDDLMRSDLTHKIWCAAILRDSTSWKMFDLTSPIEILLETLFFKVIDLCDFMGCDLEKCMPSLDRLFESSELGSLKDDASFQYLMKAGYEHIHRNYQKKNSQ